jgi:alkylation response protein AidB-like acyl-CoA dehydrogenase
MIAFEPSEEQQLIRESVAQFAQSALAPRVREAERLRAVPEDVRRLAHEMGLATLALPAEVGGQGLGMTTAVLVEEELGAADAAAAFGLGGPHAFGLAIAELGSEAQGIDALADFMDRIESAEFPVAITAVRIRRRFGEPNRYDVDDMVITTWDQVAAGAEREGAASRPAGGAP